ncbi:hypothetical protein [Bounagaea algeriensis]
MTTRTIPQASYRTELPVDYRYGTVVTLADESQGLTCSVAVASEHFRGRAQNLQGFPSFEMAAQEVKSGRSEVLLVPAAYPEIRTFFFDRALRAADTFLATLPDMVLIASDGGASKEYERLYHHPATTRLLSDLPLSFREAVPVTSNTLAGAKLAAAEEESLAITNRLVADHHGLRPLQVLAQGESMAFVVFERYCGDD